MLHNIGLHNNYPFTHPFPAQLHTSYLICRLFSIHPPPDFINSRYVSSKYFLSSVSPSFPRPTAQKPFCILKSRFLVCFSILPPPDRIKAVSYPQKPFSRLRDEIPAYEIAIYIYIYIKESKSSNFAHKFN